MAKKGHPQAGSGKKKPVAGSGGRGKKALEGRGPTPRAEDRHWFRDKKPRGQGRPSSSGRQQSSDKPDIVAGRNSVVEALRAGVPALSLHLAYQIDHDQRIKEALSIAQKKNIPLLEVTRPELDRLASEGTVHQGIVLSCEPYTYAHPGDLAQAALSTTRPLLVALDGVTDPRNLGAIIRSTAAFSGSGVIVPKRRSAGVTPAVWKTSAGQIVHAPVALAGNLVNTLQDLKAQGFFVVGLAGSGATSLIKADVSDVPVVVVVGAEGEGLSRLVMQHCDILVSIPMNEAVESLNASVAASIVLYELSKRTPTPGPAS
jgi:23S rRNA (guanosine2251-2'-O)-methyltransferase